MITRVLQALEIVAFGSFGVFCVATPLIVVSKFFHQLGLFDELLRCF